MKSLYINELEKSYDLKKTSSIFRETIGIFLAAINDWPTPILQLEDYELEVNNFIQGTTTKNKIDIALTQIDFSKDSWRAESLTQITEVFKFYPEGMSLKEIIVDFKIKFKEEKLA